MSNDFCGWYYRCQSQTQTLAVIPSVHKTKDGDACAIQLITDTAAFHIPFPSRDFQMDKQQIRIASNCFGDDGMQLNIHTECEELIREMDVVAGLIRSCIEENASQAVDQANYIERYNGYVDRYESLKARYTRLQVKREERDAEALRIGGFMFELQELGELPIAFDEKLWHGLIDHVTVYHDERLVFHFKDGSEITEQL